MTMEKNGAGQGDFGNRFNNTSALNLDGNKDRGISRGPSLAAAGGYSERTFIIDAQNEQVSQDVAKLGEKYLESQKKAAKIAEQIRAGEAEYASVTDPGIQAIRKQILDTLQEEKNGYVAQQEKLREGIAAAGGNPDEYNLH